MNQAEARRTPTGGGADGMQPEPVEPTDAEKIRGLPWINAYQAGNSVFCAFTVFGSMFVLFLGALGLPKSQIGLILSLMPLCMITALFTMPFMSRIGYKRTFVIFWGTRNLIAMLLLLTPWVLSMFGQQAAFLFVAGVIFVFGLCRAMGNAAWVPWYQATVPAAMRGKFMAMNNIIASLASAVAVGIAGYVIGHAAGLGGFMWLIGVGAAVGIFSVACIARVPGGGPATEGTDLALHLKRTAGALRDSNLLRYLAGVGLVGFGSALLAFVPLFLAEQVGLSPGQVVYLAFGSLAAILVSSYVWGWAADRYGSKPVMLAGLTAMLGYPVCMMLIPRHSPWSMPAALVLAFVGSLASVGWDIGVVRHLYVSIIPGRHKMSYTAVYAAWGGIIGGIGPIVAGFVLEASKGLQGRLLVFTTDPYTPLFVANFLLVAAALLLLRRLRSKGEVPAFEFAAMFLQGNPLAAFESLIKYNLAREERHRISMTERMGQANSPLTVDEMIEALSDPSFQVRYEAIISIGRTRRDARLMEALVKVLHGPDQALSTAAAQAFARLGDQRAIPELRKSLHSAEPALRARSARALGTLGDVEMLPVLLEQLRDEPDESLRVAYASALGALRSQEAVGDILSGLRSLREMPQRMEMALALARIVGDEGDFIGIWRDMRSEGGTALAQALVSLSKSMDKLGEDWRVPASVARSDAHTFALGNWAGGVEEMVELVRRLPLEQFEQACAAVLRDGAERLAEFREERVEYILLALHAMDAAAEAALRRANSTG